MAVVAIVVALFELRFVGNVIAFVFVHFRIRQTVSGIFIFVRFQLPLHRSPFFGLIGILICEKCIRLALIDAFLINRGA